MNATNNILYEFEIFLKYTNFINLMCLGFGVKFVKMTNHGIHNLPEFSNYCKHNLPG